MSKKKDYGSLRKAAIAALGLIGSLLAGTDILNAGEQEIITQQTELAWIEQEEYAFKIQDNKLYSLGQFQEGEREGKENSLLLLDNVLDAEFYNLDFKGNDELIVLTLCEEAEKAYKEKHSQYGENLVVYELSAKNGIPKITVKYTSNMKAMHPWMIEAGKLDDRKGEANLFVGVYKDTRFYKELLNRPFFLSWNGDFIERKWTGSYLSIREYTDLIFLDFTGDGYDEIAVIEKEENGAYQVSLYKWLTFGFEYLMSSKERFAQAEEIVSIPSQIKGEEPKIYVKNEERWEEVKFK